MARRTSYVVLLAALLISVCLVERNAADWVSDLTSNINRMTQNINDQVQRLTQHLNTEIQQNVESTIKEVNRAVENLPRDEHGRIITSNGSTIIVNNGDGFSRTIMSGRTPDGQPYVRNIVEWTVGNVLFHNETILNPRTRASERINWKLDLSTPDAKPEMLTEK